MTGKLRKWGSVLSHPVEVVGSKFTPGLGLLMCQAGSVLGGQIE